MLTIQASEYVKQKWHKTIEYFYALHLGGLSTEIQSTLIKVEELPIQKRPAALYRCEVIITPKHGHVVQLHIERENCSGAIDYSFAKAKRTLIRRARGVGRDYLFKKLG